MKDMRVKIDMELCTGCGVCVDTCMIEAITLCNGIAEINADKCVSCGACISVCPQKTIEWKKD